MECSACRHTNDSDDSFCGECGAPLLQHCARCGAELKPAKKFCTKCGEATTRTDSQPALTAAPERQAAAYTPKHLADKILKTRSALEGERKQVTVLFVDIRSSIEIASTLGPEAWHDVLDGFFNILTDGIHRYEGTVNQYTGDGVMALFGAPVAHEDHARRACYAALLLREQLKTFADRLRIDHGIDLAVRMGLNSGDVVVGKIGDDLRMDYTAQGQAVGIAQRIEQIAAAGRVYLSEHTERLVAGFFDVVDLGRTRVEGLVDPVGIFELTAASASRTRFEVARSRGLTRFVGRSAEIHALESAFDRARDGHGQVVGVVGEAGLGKSRLCHEFVERRRSEGVVVVDGHCPAHGKNIPLIPILELYRSFFGITRRDTAEEARRKIAGALVLLDPSLHESLPLLFDFLSVADPGNPAPLLDPDTRQQRLLAMLRHIYSSLAERGTPAILFIDDVHWIDRASDSFLAQMVQFIAEKSRILLLLNFRPEYSADWMRRAHYLQLPLMPLGTDAIQELVTSLLGTDDSVADLGARIVQWTGGNPFYAEEIVNELVEAGDVSGTRGSYELLSDFKSLVMPNNVRAVLAARIDRLPQNAKVVLHAAAVVGKEFEAAVLESIAELPPPDIAAALELLKDRSFIYEATLHPEIGYAFKHPLTHEVAYETLLLAMRRQLHGAVARAIELRAGDTLDEQAALLAYHWDAAEDAREAATWHIRAAEWSEMTDAAGALRHWQRARDLLTGPGSDDSMLSRAARACAHMVTVQWRLGASQDEVARDFEMGTQLAGQCGDMATLALLYGAYGSHRGVNLGHAEDYLKYAKEAVRCAEVAGDAELLFAMRGTYLYPATLEVGQWADVVALAPGISGLLAHDDLYGASFTGASPRLTALTTMYGALVNLGRAAEADSVLARITSGAAIEHSQEIGLYGLMLQIEAAALNGDTQTAVTRVQDILLLTDKVPTSLARGFALVSLGIAAQMEGNHTEAITQFSETLRVGEKTNSGGWFHATALGYLATALLGVGRTEEALSRAGEAVEYCGSGCRISLIPWVALCTTRIAAGDRAGALAALTELQTVIEQTGSVAWQPFVHEYRAAFGAAFGADWSTADELAEAVRLFSELGAHGHVGRLQARNDNAVACKTKP